MIPPDPIDDYPEYEEVDPGYPVNDTESGANEGSPGSEYYGTVDENYIAEYGDE